MKVAGGIVIVGVKMNDETILKAGLQIYSTNDLIVHCVTTMQQQTKILRLKLQLTNAL